MIKKVLLLLLFCVNLIAYSDKDELIEFIQKNSHKVVDTSNLSSIKELNLSSSAIATLPNNLYLLNSLEKIDLSNN